jgi:16S rRNA C967 or C1407 C5-methylase (RsmB/RsmF family)
VLKAGYALPAPGSPRSARAVVADTVEASPHGADLRLRELMPAGEASKRRGKRRRGGGRNKIRSDPYVRQQYGVDVEPSACQNKLMLRYYREQRIVPEEEWETFEASLRTSLPMVLRVLRNRSGWDRTLAQLRAQLGVGGGGSGGSGSSGRPLAWVPDQLAWELQNDEYTPERRRWCQLQNSLGTATFQEAVSMVPPLLLAPAPHHLVLDMCAAPGSKTLQLLELLHGADDWGVGAASGTGAGVGASPSPTPPRLATGLVVAADISSQKVTSVMAGRLRKLHSPSLALAVGNSKNFPFCRQAPPPSLPTADADHGALGPAVLFDRILCDVPCTGDGTIRKEPSIWRSWSLGFALRLHRTQLLLLRRGLRLLKPGGVLAYSTCSFNPIENEAVVLAALRALPGRVELMPTAGLLPGLHMAAGLTTWGVPDTRCDPDRSRSSAARAGGGVEGHAGAQRRSKQIERRAGDWDCAVCQAIVFASKTRCYKCQAPKRSDDAAAATTEQSGEAARVVEDPAQRGVVAGSIEAPTPPVDSLPTQVPPDTDVAPTGAAPQASSGSVCFGTYEAVPEALRPPRGPVRPSMFPQRGAQRHMVEDDDAADAERVASLARCARLLPHRNDGGGFFIALFRRTRAEVPRHSDGDLKEEEKQQQDEEEEQDEEDAAAATAVTGISVTQSAGDEGGDGDGDTTGHGKERAQQQQKLRADDESTLADIVIGANCGTSRVECGRGRLWYAQQGYELLDEHSTTWQSIAVFYGLKDKWVDAEGNNSGFARSLLATTDADGQHKQLALVSPSLQRMLLGDVGSKGALGFVSFGMRAFKRLEPSFLKPAPCRWRPCHESAAVLGCLATRRRLRLARAPMRAFLKQGWMPLEELYLLQRDGAASGLEECNAWPTMSSVEALGGLLVGLLDANETVSRRLWIASLMTGKRVESSADKAELQIALDLLGDDDQGM